MSDIDPGEALRRAGARRRGRRGLARALLVFVVLVAVAYGIRGWRHWDRHE